MPRSSGARKSTAAPTRAPPPPPPAPAAAPAGGGMMSGLMGSMMSGMATGVGMSVANRAVDAVMGPRQTEVVHRHEGAPAVQGNLCQTQQDQLSQCMQNNSDSSACQFYLDALKACQQQR